MQRTAAEQATPHGAPLPELPPELVVSIVRASKDSLVLIKLLQVCKAWRRAIIDESASLWRDVALAEYPRIHDIVKFAPQPPDFRALYRSQLTAEPGHFHLHNRGPDLDAYLLTAEMQICDSESKRPIVLARSSERLDRVLTYEPRTRLSLIHI